MNTIPQIACCIKHDSIIIDYGILSKFKTRNLGELTIRLGSFGKFCSRISVFMSDCNLLMVGHTLRPKYLKLSIIFIRNDLGTGSP